MIDYFYVWIRNHKRMLRQAAHLACFNHLQGHWKVITSEKIFIFTWNLVLYQVISSTASKNMKQIYKVLTKLPTLFDDMCGYYSTFCEPPCLRRSFAIWDKHWVFLLHLQFSPRFKADGWQEFFNGNIHCLKTVTYRNFWWKQQDTGILEGLGPPYSEIWEGA